MTCPACGRPVATEAQVAAVEQGDEWMAQGACYTAAWPDVLCDQLARDLTKRADADLLALARCVPPRALRELARVLTFGGAKHGSAPCEPSSDQRIEDHGAHARAHLEAIEDYSERDADTGALHLIHMAARGLLAAELVLAGEERK